MATLVWFLSAILTWVFLEASATENSCSLDGSNGHIFLPAEQSFLSQSRTVRTKCMILCPRNTQRQLKDSNNKDFPDSYNQDGLNLTKPLTDDTTMVTETEQETSTNQTSATKQITTVSLGPSTQPPDTTSAKPGPRVSCPRGAYGVTNDSYALTSVQWSTSSFAYDAGDDHHYNVRCEDEDKVRKAAGDFFKAGTTKVTCRAQDAAGNIEQCTFQVNVTVCNMVRLGMESGTIADHQITAKNVLNDDYENYGTALARFNGMSSWCGKIGTETWIQVEFNHTVDTYGLIIMGRDESGDYVGHVQLTYSDDGNTWMEMKEKDGSLKVYRCYRLPNTQESWVFVQTTSQTMIRSRFIRISPWLPKKSLCMRFELLSCK